MLSTSQIKKFFDSVAPRRDYWKKKNWYYYEYIEGRLMPFLVPPQKSVLEVGCGTGDLLARLNPKRGLGIDLSPEMIKVAKSKYKKDNLEFRISSVANVSEKFDYVIMSDAVGYLSDVEDTFRRLHEVTHGHSRIVINQYNYLWEPLLELSSKMGLRMSSFMQNWLSLEDIEHLLNLAGFAVVKKGRKLMMPKYVPLLSFFFNRLIVNLPLFNKLALVNFVMARPNIFLASLKDKPPSVSIIVPARNEAGTIEKIVKSLPDLGHKTEIIFVEGHSKDNTLAEIDRVVTSYRGPKVLKVVCQAGIGKWDAVKKGFDEASGDILIIYDADMTVPPEEVNKFYRALVENRGEFINGSRLVYPLEKQSMRTLNFIANKLFSLMFTWLLGQRLKDTLCGTKALWRRDYEEIKKLKSFFGDFDPFGDFFLLFGAAKLNLKIMDMPIHYWERKYGTTNIRRWKHGWLLLKMCFVAARKLKFYP